MRNKPAKPVTQTKYYPFNGGIDVVTPALSVDPGFALTLVNYEPWYNGGYRRVDGFERFSGAAKPSAAVFRGAPVSSLAGFVVGTNTTAGTGVSSGAVGNFVISLTVAGTVTIAGTVTAVNTSWVAITNVTGSFTNAEAVYFAGAGTSTGTFLATPSVGYGPVGTNTTTFLYTSDMLAAAQSYYRANIAALPGTGNVLGAWQNGTNNYAWRGTGTGTSAKAVMYLSTSTNGWGTGGITYCTTLYYNGLITTNGTFTGSIDTNGVASISGISAGVLTTNMVLSDPTGYIPTDTTVVSQLSGAVGGVGTYQLSQAPAAAISSEVIYGFNAGINVPTAGQIVVGVTSLVTATVYASVPQDITVGYLALTGVSGTFTSGESLEVDGSVFAAASGTQTTFNFGTGTNVFKSFYRFMNKNFFASSSTYNTYGVNNLTAAFQIDQNNIVMPILMPQTPLSNQPANNTPFFLAEYQNFLWLAFPGGIVQQSVQGVPYQYDGFLGAAEFGVGAEITGMYSIVGPALAIMTTKDSWTVNGTSDASFTLTKAAEKVGAVKYAAQGLDTVYALNELGITSLSRTQSYGNFVGATISQLVQPIVASLRPNFADSAIVRSTNEARFYFTDGSVLIMYVPGLGQQNKAWSAVESGVTAQFGYASYPNPIYNISNSEDQNGNEVSYFGSTNGDGFVYQDRSGTSWDGAQITSYVRLAFNNVGSPATRKYFRRADLELNALSALALKFAWDLSYSNAESSSAVYNETASQIQAVNVFGGGGYWDSIYWNNFDWDAQAISSARASLNGTGENISFLIFHQAIVDSPFILQGLVLHFDPRRYQR
jgi:hypothetical protein